MKWFSSTGLSPSLVGLSRHLRLTKLHFNNLPQQVFLSIRYIQESPWRYFLTTLTFSLNNQRQDKFGLFPFRSPLLRECCLAIFEKLPNFVFFSFGYWDVSLPRVRHSAIDRVDFVCHEIRFPHSEIPGSKVARHLPEAFRSHATSFIAFRSRGIHHLLISKLIKSQKPWLAINNNQYSILKNIFQSLKSFQSLPHFSNKKPLLLEAAKPIFIHIAKLRC